MDGLWVWVRVHALAQVVAVQFRRVTLLLARHAGTSGTSGTAWHIWDSLACS
jgi:hypothetical protein